MSQHHSPFRRPRADFDQRWWLVPVALAGATALLAVLTYAWQLDATPVAPAPPESRESPAVAGDVAAAIATHGSTDYTRELVGEEQPATF